MAHALTDMPCSLIYVSSIPTYILYCLKYMASSPTYICPVALNIYAL
jgi:hypothetical protein